MRILAAVKFPATYGGYTLLAELGEGGMATVFLARKIGPGGFAKLQVIKRILPHLGKEPEFVQMFLDEARLAARFEHPNVVQVYDLGEADGQVYLAMEYLAGQSVAALAREAVKQGISVPPQFSARIIADACDGLHYVHEFKDPDGTPLRIVHRDVSPQNLFVTYEGRVKLLDFGVAKAATTVTKTRTGSVKGKVSYMAPEQCRGENVDRRADIFALGVVLTELIGGRRMFKSDNEFALIRQLSLGEYPKPSEMGFEGAPKELLHIADRAMSFRAEDRYASCLEMRVDLDKWLATSGPSGSRQVAGLMGQLFKEDIALRQQILSAPDDSAPVFQMVRQEASQPSLPSLGPLALDQRTVTRKSVEVPAVQPPPGRAPWLLAAALVVLAGAGFAVAWKLLQPPPPLPPPVVVVTPPPQQVEVDAGAEAVVVPTPAEVPDASVAVAVVVAPPKKKTPPPTKQAPGTLNVKSTPSGCAVSIDGKPAGTTPWTQVFESVSEPQVTVACQGYAAETKPARLASGNTVTLDFAPQPLGKGFLALKTSPWSVVFEGERELGMTPLAKLELAAGQHTLRAVNKEQQLEKTFVVTIKAGEVTAKTVDLTTP